MRYGAIAERLPGPIGRHVLHFEAAIDSALVAFAAGVPAGARVLDAGAGEGRHARHFAGRRYVGTDLGVGDAGWDYSGIDVRADLAAMPFRTGSFDAAIHVVTLEHVKEPLGVLSEIARVLAPGARLLIVAPHEWEVHQSPHDYYRYTRHGMAYLIGKAGLEPVTIEPAGGYFRLLARRLLNGLQFFSGGWRWILFLPAAIILVPPALFLPWLDFLDKDRNFTLGYICTARKP